jgi:hypothetical protein
MTIVELRVLFVIGLLVTAVVAYVVAMGAFAAVTWLRRQGAVRPAAAPIGPTGAMTPLRADAERRAHVRQAAGRLRC